MAEPKSDWWEDGGIAKLGPERLERIYKTAQLWNRGHLTVRQIAAELGVSPATVCRDRKRLIDLWRSTVLADVNDVVARELAKLDDVERELWLAWERSKRDVEIMKQKERRRRPIGGDGEELVVGREVDRTTRGRIPEARYMDLILDVGERRARLLGLDKGIKLDDMTFDIRDMIKRAAEREKEIAAKIRKARKADGRTD
jgi:hypothetical protein